MIDKDFEIMDYKKTLELPKIYEDTEGRNYPEDYKLENGNYMNTCIRCKLRFFGHKRRVICKSCADNIGHEKTINPTAQIVVDTLKRYSLQTGNLLRHYIVIETNRWAVNDEKEWLNIMKDFQTRLKDIK